jgi:hypothetical protein
MWIVSVRIDDIYNGVETKYFEFTKKENAENEYTNQIKNYLRVINKFDCDYDFIFSGVSAYTPKEYLFERNNFYLELIDLLLKYDAKLTSNKRNFTISMYEE